MISTFCRHSVNATRFAFFGTPFWAFCQYTWRFTTSSLPVAGIIAFFSGAVLMAHAVSSLSIVGGGPVSAYIVSLGGVRELFPLLAASALACQAGGDIAAELSTRRWGQELLAIESMGMDVHRLMIGPQTLACIVSAGLIVPFANAVGLIAAYFFGVWQLGIDPGNMQESLVVWLHFSDLMVGMQKGMLFGWIVGIIATYQGLHGKGKNVGDLASRAIVQSLIAGYLLSFLLSYAVYGNSSLG